MPNWYQVGHHFANKYNIPWQLYRALINQESGWNPNARSPAGAIGFAQLMPGTAQGLGVNPYNPRQNLRGGAEYLANQYNTFGRWRKALAAYNAGPGAVQSGAWKSYPETRNYVSSIWSAYQGPNRTGPGQAFSPIGHGSFMAPAPGALAEVQRKQAALSLLASIPGSGLEDPLAAALGKKIGQNVDMKRYGFNFPMPGFGGGDLQGAALMRAIIALAQRRGFQVGENPLVGGVSPVHAGQSAQYGDYSGSGNPSYHYQHFPNHPHVGRAIDINWVGNAPSAAGAQAIEDNRLLGLFRAIRHRYGLSPFQELLLPGRTYFAGSPLQRYTYSGHDNHFHLAI